MPRKYRIKEVVSGYKIRRDEFYHAGLMALSYAADAPDGTRVFFKQYKSPTPTVGWYKKYIDYQKEIKRRIESDKIAKEFCYDMLHFFEYPGRGKPTNGYHQIFEWVSASKDLEQVLEEVKKKNSPDFGQRLILAKRLMGGIANLHRAGVIHCDLKPANIQLISDPSIKAEWKLILIDMDYSILNDRKAPWHGQQSYVGSPNYFSPEHINNKAPLEVSDVFTCGLILYELLAEGHPYASDSHEDFAEAVNSYKAGPPKLKGAMDAPATNEQVSQYLHRCLDPNPDNRPSAKDVQTVLNGRLGAKTSSPKPPSTPYIEPPKPLPEEESAIDEPPLPEPTTEEPPKSSTITLHHVDSGKSLVMHMKTIIGRTVCRQFGDDSQFWTDPQFTLERDEEGWMVIPNTGAKNETMLNGKAIASDQILKDGDELAVGRESKGIIKLPLGVKITE